MNRFRVAVMKWDAIQGKEVLDSIIVFPQDSFPTYRADGRLNKESQDYIEDWLRQVDDGMRVILMKEEE